MAAVPFWPPFEWEGGPFPIAWFATEEVIQARGVGVGDDLIVVGLFSQHVGKSRNLPIVRSGHVASMPLEPFVDEDTGDLFNAYLAEVRSIGGLSGSPVLLALNPYTRLNIFGDAPGQDTDVGGAESGLTFYVLGLIRGHWRERVEGGAGSLNTGIAMVTPITEVLPLLEREELVPPARDRQGHCA